MYKEIDVLMINPPFLQITSRIKSTYPYRYPPPGIFYVTASLLKANFKTEIYNPIYTDKTFGPKREGWPPITEEARAKFKEAYIDYPNSPIWKQIRDYLSQIKPKIVGISITSSCNYDSSTYVARIARELYPDVPIIVGGVHPTELPEQTLECPYFDVAVIGEGEITSVELVDALLNKKPLKDIKGIVFKENGKYIHTEPRPAIMNIDDIAPPLVDTVYDDFPRRSLTTARGCPYKCTFCSQSIIQYKGGKVRYHSPERVLSEIEYWYNKGISSFVIQDSTFTINKKHVSAICEGILEHNWKIDWAAQIRADKTDENILRLMKKAGCSYLWLGAESGSAPILKSIKKGVTPEQIVAASKIVNKVGIDLNIFLIAGFPGEKEENLRDTEHIAEIVSCNGLTPNILTPYLGCEIYDYAVENNLLRTKDWFFYISTFPYVMKKDLSEEVLLEHYNRMLKLSEKKRKKKIRQLFFRPKEAYRKFISRSKTSSLSYIFKKATEAWF